MGQSISAFDAAAIENRFATSIAHIVNVSPNLIIDDTRQGPGGVAAIFIRGPQGTLFGRNSIGGVVNVTRMKPIQELSGKVRFGYGNYETAKLDSYVAFGQRQSLGSCGMAFHRRARGGLPELAGNE